MDNCKNRKKQKDGIFGFFCEHYHCDMCGDCSECDYYEPQKHESEDK